MAFSFMAFCLYFTIRALDLMAFSFTSRTFNLMAFVVKIREFDVMPFGLYLSGIRPYGI